MWADVHTKSKQGLKFYTDWAFMMNCPIDYNDVAARTLVPPKLLQHEEEEKENSPPVDRTKPASVRRSVLNEACSPKIRQRNLLPTQRVPLTQRAPPRRNQYNIQTPQLGSVRKDPKQFNFLQSVRRNPCVSRRLNLRSGGANRYATSR